MYTAITVFIIITSILLMLVVLVQNSKGGGLAAGFNSGTQVMGVRKTTDVLEKMTWGLAVAVFVLCVAGTFFLPRTQTSVGGTSTIQEQIDQAQVPKEQMPQMPPASTTQQPTQQPAQQPAQ